MNKNNDKGKKIHEDPDVAAAIVAQMYFLHRGPHTLEQIGKKFGLDKATISRYVKRAREHHIVDVTFNLPREQTLELTLKGTFNLFRAIVFPIVQPDENGDKHMFHRLLGQAAARHLEQEGGPLSNGDSVGISCGATLRELISALTPDRFKDMTISQLTIEAENRRCLDVAPFTLVGMLSGKWSGGHHEFFAVQPLPGTMHKTGTEQDEDGWYKEYGDCRREIGAKSKNLSVAIMGVGHFNSATNSGSFFQVMPDRGISLKEFEKAGTVGEICNRPFDAFGNDLTSRFESLRCFVDGVDIETLRHLVVDERKVIVVAGGKHQVEAIKVVLENRIANYLITDTETAEQLLEIA